MIASSPFFHMPKTSPSDRRYEIALGAPSFRFFLAKGWEPMKLVLQIPAQKANRHATRGISAVSLMPNAFITASVVFSVGFPFLLKER
jgi:hypothetical protein